MSHQAYEVPEEFLTPGTMTPKTSLSDFDPTTYSWGITKVLRSKSDGFVHTVDYKVWANDNTHLVIHEAQTAINEECVGITTTLERPSELKDFRLLTEEQLLSSVKAGLGVTACQKIETDLGEKIRNLQLSSIGQDDDISGNPWNEPFIG